MATEASEMPVEAHAPQAAAPSIRSLLPDPAMLWMIFRRHLKLFLIAAGLVLAAVATFALLATPIYSATTSVLITPGKGELVEPEKPNGNRGPEIPAGFTVDTEVRMIGSPTVAKRVLEQLQREDANRSDAPYRSVSKLLSQVEIVRSGSTLVIDIIATSTDPEDAARIANTFATEYLALQTATKAGDTRLASQYIDARLDGMQRKVNQSEAEVERYRVANGLMSAEGATMAEQEVSNLNQQIAAARAELAEKSGRLSAARAQLRRGGGGADVGAALGSQTISSLRAQQADASRLLAQLQARYGDRYPDVIKAQGQLNDIDRQIQLEIDRIVSSLEAEQAVAQSRLNSLEGSQGNARGSLASNSSAAVGLQELERKAEADKAIYEAFLARSKETTAQQGLQTPDARIATAATVPTLPVFPDYPLLAFFGVVAAIGAGLGSIAVAEYLQGGIQTRYDVEKRLRMRYAGAVPVLHSTIDDRRGEDDPLDYIVKHPFSTFAESFRNLKAFLLLRGGGNVRVVAITSPLPKDGKTTTSACLARSSALGGTKTVIVDCDLRRHGTTDLLVDTPTNGLVRALNKEIPLREALVRDPATGLYILGCSEAPTTAYDPLTPANVKRLIEELKEEFELIIVDTAPVLALAETRTIAAMADTVLMLARWRETPLKAMDAAIDMLLSANAKIAGVALTMVDIRKYAATGQDDVYSYHKKFGGYYMN